MVEISFIDRYYFIDKYTIISRNVQFQLVNTYTIVTVRSNLSQIKLNGTDVMSDKTGVTAADERSVVCVSCHTHQVVNG